MSLRKKIPWLSLSLLLIAYGTFGWFLSRTTTFRFTWVFALIFALMLAWILTSPLRGLSSKFLQWSVSGAGSLILCLIISMLVALALVQARILSHVLIILSAEILVRLDMQTSGFNKVQAFLLLTGTSLAGLEIGWLMQRLVAVPATGG
jgi:hypothetical protein